MHLDVDDTEFLGPLIEAVFGIPGVGASIGNHPVDVDNSSRKCGWPRRATPSSPGSSVPSTPTNTPLSCRICRTFDAVSGTPVTGLPNFFSADNDSVFEEIAGFGDVTYHFTSAFDITGGLRYSHNDQHFITNADGIINGGPTFADVKSSDSSTTWLVNPRFHINDDTMLYARVATGYRPGGPNTGVAGTPLTYDPDTVTNYELGMKSDLLDRRLSLEAAAYWIDWKDIQLQQVSAAGISYIANGGEAVSRGFDLSVNWLAVEGLQLYANTAYQDTYLTQDFRRAGRSATRAISCR